MICALSLAAAGAQAAQDMLRAAAVVNDEVVSGLDLDMRLRLAILATGQPDSEQLRGRMTQQVIRTLIDERLQAQEAARLGITITDEQVQGAAQNIAQRNKMSYEKFTRLLQSRGIIPNAFLDQVRGQVTWNTLIARRLRPSVQVTEEDVEDMVRRITANRGLKQRRVFEIFLSVDTALREDEVLGNAERLFEQLRAGAKFAVLAREFSESASAARGGDLGWVREGQLSEELDSALAGMRPGTLSRPIRTLSGFHILLLRDEKTTSLGKVTLHLKQLLFALAEDASEDRKRSVHARAEEARGKITGCAAVDDLAAEIGAPGSGDLGKIELNDLPPNIREVVASQAIGQPTPALPMPSALSVLVVCERTESGVDRKKIKNRLTSQRLDMLARRYMRDLRHSANVDIRL